MEQHSPEWWAARCGKVTASRIGDLMRKIKSGAWSADHHNYLKEKVAERITGRNKDRKKVASLDARLDLEPDARATYGFYYENQIELVGFIDHPRIPMCGASPDGLVGSDGGVEIKCCDTETHIETITAGYIDRDYLLQIQFGMACTDREWWDFISFDPNMPEEGKLYVQRVERDESLISQIETSVIEFLAEVDQKVEQVNALVKGKTPLEVVLSGSLSSLGIN